MPGSSYDLDPAAMPVPDDDDADSHDVDDFDAYLTDLHSIGGSPDSTYESPCSSLEHEPWHRPKDEKGKIQLLLAGEIREEFLMNSPDFTGADDGSVLAYEYEGDTHMRKAVITKELDILTPAEVEQHRPEVDAATLE